MRKKCEKGPPKEEKKRKKENGRSKQEILRITQKAFCSAEQRPW